jgi:hypothetical protein
MDHDTAQIGFYASLGLTVAVLAVSMYLGHKAKTKAHIATVATFLVVFLVTVFFAEMLGRFYTTSSPSDVIHLTIAVLTSIGTAAPLYTGFQHLKGKATLKTHRKVVAVWLVGIVSAVGTGIWMLSASERKAPAEVSRSE